MIKNIKELECIQDNIGAWYYTLDGIPYTGSAIQMYPNGNMAAESHFVNGYFEGRQRVWHQNGRLMSEENFSNNIQHGRCLSWYENGGLKYECECSFGKTIWSKKYNEQGELIKSTP